MTSPLCDWSFVPVRLSGDFVTHLEWPVPTAERWTHEVIKKHGSLCMQSAALPENWKSLIDSMSFCDLISNYLFLYQTTLGYKCLAYSVLWSYTTDYISLITETFCCMSLVTCRRSTGKQYYNPFVDDQVLTQRWSCQFTQHAHTQILNIFYNCILFCFLVFSG